MPPAKRPPTDDAAAALRERQIASAAHARSKKAGAAAQQNGIAAKEALLANNAATAEVVNGSIAGQNNSTASAWSQASPEFLERYRVAHKLNTPAAFTSPYRQALLTNPGIGRQSPTMAREKRKRRVEKEKLAAAVRKHFNDAAVNETDVVVDFLYKAKNKDKAFRMRPGTGGILKKQA